MSTVGKLGSLWQLPQGFEATAVCFMAAVHAVGTLHPSARRPDKEVRLLAMDNA